MGGRMKMLQKEKRDKKQKKEEILCCCAGFFSAEVVERMWAEKMRVLTRAREMRREKKKAQKRRGNVCVCADVHVHACV